MTRHARSRWGRLIIFAGMVAAAAAAVSACGGSGSPPPPGTWVTMSSPVNGTTGRAFHAAVPLDSGDFLLIGGQDGDGSPLIGTQYAERFRLSWLGFDRETAFDTNTATRVAPAAALVPDSPADPSPTLDDVVIVGGQTAGAGFIGGTTTAPADAVWLDLTTPPNNGGGEYYMAELGPSGLSAVEINDLPTGTTPVDIQGAALVADPNNGVVYMIGGRDAAGNALADIRWFDPGAGPIGGGGAFVDAGAGVNGTLTIPRYGHTATLTQNGNILVAGGWDASGNPTNTTEIISAAGGPGTLTSAAGPVLEIPRAAHTATAINGGFDVLLFGGVTSAGALAGAVAGHTVEQLDQTGGFLTAWTATARVYHTATRINTFDVLIAGGLVSDGGTGFVASDLAEIIDTSTTPATMHATGSLATPRFGHSATQIDGGTVVVAGGLSGWSTGAPSVPAINSAERYFPERY